MSATEILRLAAGLALLLGGAEALVRGASRLAAALRVSPLLIGLTVVAFGTSSPELAASLASARRGAADLALGNVVGSNIFNVLFILGIAALVAPLAVHRKLVRLDVPIMIGVSALPFWLGRDGSIDRGDGAGLVLVLAAYVGFLIWEARREGVAAAGAPAEAGAETSGGAVARGPASLGIYARGALAALAGLAMLTLGATWLVGGATSLARALGVSDLVIGLTLVAAGTSLPEVATSVVASVRGQRDLAVGNVVGSNIFNVLGVLGVAAMASPAGVAVPRSAWSFDLPVMLAASVACFPVFFTRLDIDRWEGGLFLLAYSGYVWLLLTASRSAVAASPLGLVAGLAVGVAVLAAIQLRRRQPRAPTAS